MEINRSGEVVKGHFLIKGGTISQELKRIDCDLVTFNRTDEREEIVDSISILTTKIIQSEAVNKIPFSFLLPNNARLSTDTLSYRFKTRLAFKQGVESLDQDAIRIIQD
ncbi:sporulation protein [Bacillus sp. DTU_2020_1000418_1_SI_GHA_SEK_038]|uniref:sporulation protein n=1 Tax=Bacillus sp. DTU_2020_1000418_1_SI_GHA_SEK_038 TaxID=3077585 RepID=UPI0028EAF43A|nr:sporulation protein [Bacillus sp. DTU_2020_1000418_1_SI_GHA_SEK_038]WNS73635.1 sporulation protein [Bacillus sp. DTU_2020_1000418_1_SI_GHA_SEK_038]